MGNWKWVALSAATLALLVGGTVMLGQTAGKAAPSSKPTAASTADRVDNCVEWITYATMGGVEPLQHDRADCRAAVAEDPTKFAHPPTDDEWANVTG